MAGWMKTPLGTEVDIGPVHIVLDGVIAPAKGVQQPPPLFSAHVYCMAMVAELLLSFCWLFNFCIRGAYLHVSAIWRIRLNRPCATAMRPYVKLDWPLVFLTAENEKVLLSTVVGEWTTVFGYTLTAPVTYLTTSRILRLTNRQLRSACGSAWRDMMLLFRWVGNVAFCCFQMYFTWFGLHYVVIKVDCKHYVIVSVDIQKFACLSSVYYYRTSEWRMGTWVRPR